MPIDEAIAALQQDFDYPGSVPPLILRRAKELGFEALKRVRGGREVKGITAIPFLPGETEE